MKPKSLVQINPSAPSIMLLRPNNTAVVAMPPGNQVTLNQMDVTKLSFEVNRFVVLQYRKDLKIKAFEIKERK